MNKKHQIVLIVCIIPILIVLGSIGYAYKNDLYIFSNLNSITSEEFQNILASDNDESIFVYIGRDSCEVCQAVKPKLEQELKKEQMEIYYYNTDKNRGDELFESILEKIEVTKVPTLLEIKQGIVINRIEGNQSNERINTFL